jgi:hypothetical protein
MPGNDSEKDSCAALGLPATLLPIAQRTRADAHERRESRLAQTIPLANCPHVRLPDLKGARRLATTPKDRPAFPYALPKLLEKIFLHRYSVSAICRMINSFAQDGIKGVRDARERNDEDAGADAVRPKCRGRSFHDDGAVRALWDQPDDGAQVAQAVPVGWGGGAWRTDVARRCIAPIGPIGKSWMPWS